MGWSEALGCIPFPKVKTKSCVFSRVVRYGSKAGSTRTYQCTNISSALNAIHFDAGGPAGSMGADDAGASRNCIRAKMLPSLGGSRMNRSRVKDGGEGTPGESDENLCGCLTGHELSGATRV